MSPPSPSEVESRAAGPDASSIFRFPIVMMGLLTGIAGALDVVEYRDFGLFTANQGGNLVLFWVRLQERSSLTWVIAASVLGAMVGVALVVVLRMRVPFFAGAVGARLSLTGSALILLASFLIMGRAAGSNSYDALYRSAEFSSEWWLMVRLVTTSALAMGVLGATIVSVRGVAVSAIAPTGAFVTGTRLATMRLLGETPTRVRFRSIVTIPVSWTLGAAFGALVPVSRDVIVLLGVGVILLLVAAVRSQPAGTGPQ